MERRYERECGDLREVGKWKGRTTRVHKLYRLRTGSTAGLSIIYYLLLKLLFPVMNYSSSFYY